MPYIKVNTDKIKTYTTELESIRTQINCINQKFSNESTSMYIGIREVLSRDIAQIENELYIEATSLTKMRNYLLSASGTYDTNERAKISRDTINTALTHTQSTLTIASAIFDTVSYIGDVLDAGKEAEKITYFLKNGQVYYSRGEFIGGGYDFSTWMKNGAIGNLRFNWIDKVQMGLTVASEGIKMGVNLYNVWTDENKSTEKKICDTIANVGCSATNVAIRAGGVVVGKLAGGAVAAACCVIPVVGPIVGAVAGFATSTVVGMAAGILADTVTSEAVVNQVSDSIETVVGAAKAGVQAVSDKAKAVAEAEGLDKVAKTAELVGTAVVETAKVAVTATVEAVKTVATTAVETVKNVGKAIANVFKGW